MRVSLETVRQAYRVTRLGESISGDRVISRDALERSMKVLHQYNDIIHRYKVHAVKVFGTEMLRQAVNTYTFSERVKENFGWSVSVISGEEEARLTYAGAITGIITDAQPALVVDVGGGSTELVQGEGRDVLSVCSIPLGVVRMAEKMQLREKLSSKNALELILYIRQSLSGHKDILQGSSETILIGSGGTMTTVAAIKQKMPHYDPEKLHGFMLTLSDLESFYHRINKMTLTERKKLPGMLAGREDVLLYGILIFIEILKMAGQKEIYATDRGLRYGYLQSTKSIGD